MSKKPNSTSVDATIQKASEETLGICGVVMPISAIEDCSEAHWVNVYEIIKEAVYVAGYETNIVSFSDDVGVIQKKIVQNLYDNPIVVVDISAKNPNVMFELGLRLAFDKPTIIIKDDRTSNPFDTSIIEHITYPRDLRYQSINDFKNKLTSKITATVHANKSGEHTTFLGHFGKFKVAQLDAIEVSGAEYVMEQLQEIKSEIKSIKSIRTNNSSDYSHKISTSTTTVNEARDRATNYAINLAKTGKYETIAEYQELLHDYINRHYPSLNHRMINDIILDAMQTSIKF